MTKDDEKNDGKDKVGYGKPPTDSRFRPGVSGNPKGRPKGCNNLKTDVLETLKAPVPVSENGKKQRKVSTQKAMLMRLREKALKGDPKALDRLLALAQTHNNEELAHEAGPNLNTNDTEIIERYKQRVLGDATADTKDAERERKIEEAWRLSGLGDDNEGDDSWLN